ncbi:hypothetical protein BOTCAL_0388g00080 [Botryotinia calthae]|uniref:Uncharacterized protein n=1 Tax=Botryotinia calthae TaxID=38488 RepID=A0A4Y8CTH4_9HELO|nr:hypothetical protein BOTCAL_0388g00080 [Botryotinia calthae]
MKSNKQGHLQRKFSLEAGEQRGISDLPTRTKKSQDADNLPDPQHHVLIEYRVANETLGTRLLSTGVLLINESSSYWELLTAIQGRPSNWENVPLNCMEKSVAVRWKIGQAVNDDSYDTLCGPGVVVSSLILMMRERHWKDRLVVVYYTEESDGSDGRDRSEEEGMKPWTRGVSPEL